MLQLTAVKVFQQLTIDVYLIGHNQFFNYFHKKNDKIDKDIELIDNLPFNPFR